MFIQVLAGAKFSQTIDYNCMFCMSRTHAILRPGVRSSGTVGFVSMLNISINRLLCYGLWQKSYNSAPVVVLRSMSIVYKQVTSCRYKRSLQTKCAHNAGHRHSWANAWRSRGYGLGRLLGQDASVGPSDAHQSFMLHSFIKAWSKQPQRR